MRRLFTLMTCALLSAVTVPAAAQTLPELPAVTGRQARTVRHVERVARRTLRCVMVPGERGGEEYENPACWDWYDGLAQAGRLGALGVGRVLLAELESDEAASSPPAELPVGQSRLIQLLGDSGSPRAVVYLTHALRHAGGTQPRHVQLAVETLDALGRLAGQDVTPLPAWQSPYEALAEPGARVQLAHRWAAWYAAHEGQRRRAWREEGLSLARAQIDAADPVARFAAIRRLDERGRAHHALRDALSAMIRDPSLSPEAKRYVSRYATRHGLLQRGEVRVLLMEARS
ncbi:MAG: hypothetical protein AB8I08_38095 [Sandaracinaceae bacterium]